MTVATGLLAVAAFVAALYALRVIEVARGAMGVMTGAMGAMRDPGLDDDAREAAVQAASLKLFGRFGQILWRLAATLGLSYLPILLADVTGLAEGTAVMDWLLRLDVILLLSALMIAAWFLATRPWPRR